MLKIKKPKVIGITGTNGKTTTTYIVKHILNSERLRCAVIGTLNNRLTTPSPWHLKRIFRRLKNLRYDWIAMEVSSHGIKQGRVKNIDFFIKALTNISQDHLDYHKTMADYIATKMGWFLAKENIKISFFKDALDSYKINNQVLTDFYQRPFYEQNKILATEICKAIGIKIKNIELALRSMPQIPGRFEYIKNKKNYHIVIDFAHTPDGLEKALKEARHNKEKSKLQGKLIVVFGCGGDRDKGKRPEMAKIAEKHADFIIITSDNPRNEEPDSIIKDILEGIDNKDKILIEANRKEAIATAIKNLTNQDFLLIAGKGHETYQIIKDVSYHFSDKEEVLKWV